VRQLSSWLLGPAWSGVGEILVLLLPYMISQFAVAPLTQTLNAVGRNGQQLAWDVARLGGVGAAFLPVVVGGGATRVGIVAFSAVTVVAYGVHVVLTRRALRQAGRAATSPGGPEPAASGVRSGPSLDRSDRAYVRR
jgi:O-antigen/teichoic acid export membrane protein